MAIDIPIVTTFSNKGAKSAISSMLDIENAAKKMGTALIGAFAVGNVIAFGKQSVAAFVAEDKAAKTLGQTLKNLGLGFQTNGLNDYIVQLADATGVTKDQLRPALESLLRVTGDSSTAQDLLNLSMNISAGTGRDLTTVAGALSKAYGGQMTALSRLGTGLTAAQLKSKDFGTIYEQLNALFAGQATTAANSAAGALDRIAIAAGDAKEIIGNGLITALDSLNSHHTGVDAVQSAMKGTAQYVADTVAGIALMIAKLESIKLTDHSNPFSRASKNAFGNLVQDIPVIGSWIAFFNSAGAQARKKAALANQPIAGLPNYSDLLAGNESKGKALAIQAASAKAAADQLKATQALAKAAADKLKLDKAASVFNIQGIEIAAALKGKISDQDRIRLELQQAILDKNADKAASLQNQLENSIAANKALSDQIDAIKTATNPFTALLQGAKDSLAAVLALQSALLMGSITGTDGSTSPTVTGHVPTYSSGTASFGATDMPSQAGATVAQAATYNIAINAGTVVDHTTLVQMLQDQITQNGASGIQPLWVRNALPAGAL